MRAVAGAGIEQAGNTVTGQAIEIDLREAQGFAQQWPQQQCPNQGADGCKRQCVGEVAVIVQHQQYIVRTLDQGIRIRQHAANHADSRRESALVRRRQRGSQGGAEHAVGYQVHRGILQSGQAILSVCTGRVRLWPCGHSLTLSPTTGIW